MLRRVVGYDIWMDRTLGLKRLDQPAMTDFHLELLLLGFTLSLNIVLLMLAHA